MLDIFKVRLLELYNELKQELKQNKRLGFSDEEIDYLMAVSISSNNNKLELLGILMQRYIDKYMTKNKITVNIPEGEFCSSCQFLNDGAGFEYNPSCQLELVKNEVNQYGEGINIQVKKATDCPSLKQ
jgi:hypothetical protein